MMLAETHGLHMVYLSRPTRSNQCTCENSDARDEEVVLPAQGDRAVEPIAWSGTSAEAAFLSSLSFRQTSSISGVAWCMMGQAVKTLMLLMQ